MKLPLFSREGRCARGSGRRQMRWRHGPSPRRWCFGDCRSRGSDTNVVEGDSATSQPARSSMRPGPSWRRDCPAEVLQPPKGYVAPSADIAVGVVDLVGGGTTCSFAASTYRALECPDAFPTTASRSAPGFVIAVTLPSTVAMRIARSCHLGFGGAGDVAGGRCSWASGRRPTNPRVRAVSFVACRARLA